MRHVLFAVTPGVDVRRLRDRAEAALLELRCHPTARLTVLRAWRASCPTAPAAHRAVISAGSREDCAPEFARELFAGPEIGVLPRLVHSRFGLHVVEVRAREPGTAPAFEAVRGAVAQTLRQQSFVSALRQYLQLLAGAAAVEGVVAGQRRHAAGAVGREARCMNIMDIASFDDLLQAAREQAEPQQLLFVFAGAELPAGASAQQRAQFEAGEGGELAPLMCVDKPAAELCRIRRAVPPRRRRPARPGPSSSRPRCRAATARRPRAAHPRRVQHMVDSIKSGRLDGMLPFNRDGEPVQLA